MQGLIGGFANGDPSAIQSRRDSFAAFVASLSPKVWLDATGLTPGLLSTWPDLSGNGNDATAAGAARPTATGGAEVTFGGAQAMDTPSFTMGARSSGACVVRFTATNQGAFQFGPLNGHTSAITQNLGTDLAKLRIAAGGAGEAGIAASYPMNVVLAWSTDAASGTVIVNGTSSGITPIGLVGVTSALRLGDITGGIFALTGAIHEIAIVDAVTSGANLTALHDGMRAKWGI